ncbi:cytidylate kinase-like family protein [bacterium]|nr:cytidylate kinase-like family protein [bacterium]
MSIITISRSFCSGGELIAKKLASELGYTCLSREVLHEASELFNVPEIKLAKAIHDKPSFFDRITHGKEIYLSFIRAALLNHIKEDNIVYHGLAGHFFLQNIPHVLKVRTLSDMEDRIAEEMQRNGVSATVARKHLLQDDKQRLNWSIYLYKMDTADPELYDLILNTKNMSVDDCVKIIRKTVELDCYRFSDEARKALDNEALAANVKAAIVEKYPEARVSSYSGNVTIKLTDPKQSPEKVKSDIKSITKSLPGVVEVTVTVKSNVVRTGMHK